MVVLHYSPSPKVTLVPTAVHTQKLNAGTRLSAICYERDNGKGRNGAYLAVRFLSGFTLRVKAGVCNHFCPDRVSVHQQRNVESSADSLKLTRYVKSITVFIYTQLLALHV